MKKRIAVYGSLLSGFGNHMILDNPETTLLGEDEINIPYGMVSYGGFPALVPSEEDHNIKIEVYECDDHTYNRVERLEGYPSFYQKFDVDTKFGSAEIYVINKERNFESQPESIKVTDGDWREYKTSVYKY